MTSDESSSAPGVDDPSPSALRLPEPAVVAPPPSKPRVPRQVSPRPVRLAVWGVAALAGLAAAFADTAPTGQAAADVLWTAGFAVVVTFAASRATRAAALWMATVAAVAAIGSVAVVPGVAALLLSLVASARQLRDRIVGAVTGGLAVVALLHLPDIGPHGVPSLLAAAAVAPVLWTGYKHSPRRVRRRIRRGVGVGVGLVALAALGLGAVSLMASSRVTDGIEDARVGADLVRDGEHEAAAARFESAEDELSSAHSVLGGVLGLPARVVPVLAQQSVALSTAAEQGANLAGSAGSAASTAPYQDLRASAGRVDLDQVRAMQEPVGELDAILVEAGRAVDSARSPWLARPLADGLDDLQGEIDDVAPEAAIADDALRVAPEMLGASGPRSYLVLFTSPAESRFLGGFSASYGVLTADRGAVDLTVDGTMNDLAAMSDPAGRRIEGEDEFLARWGRLSPERYFQNLTASPDMATTAEVAAQMYEQTAGTPVDGVIVVDPFGLAALLELTGPIEVPDRDRPLTADTVTRYLLIDQYVEEADRTERKERLEDVGRETFDALTERDLPGPRTIGDVLGPVVREKRLMFHPFDEDGLRLMDDLGVSGTFARTDGADLVSLRTSNAEPNKLDSFLDRDVTYDVTYDARSGAVAGRATVVLTNRAPAEGLPDYIVGTGEDLPRGTTRLYVSLYSPLELRSLSADGEEVGIEAQDELGVTAYSTIVEIPAGGHVTLVFELAGEVAPGGYRVDVLPQPSAGASDIDLRISSADGAPALEPGGEGVGRAGAVVGAGPSRRDVVLTAEVDG